jgi:methyl-accepting chemotaxis protein
MPAQLANSCTRRLRTSTGWTQSARSILFSCLYLVACASPGDPERVEAQARAFKAAAADSTNVLLYLVQGLEVQTKDVQITRKIVDIAKNDPKARNLEGFMSLAPELVGWSESLRLARPARRELRTAAARSQARIAEINTAVSDLGVSLSEDRTKLGRLAPNFEEAHTQLKETTVTLGTFASALETYLDGEDGLESSANSSLRELKILPHNSTLSEDAATIARLSGFTDEIAASAKKIAESLDTERASRDAGLASLLVCSRTLDSMAGLPPQLSQELQELTKLIEDVQNGAPFSPKR